VKQEHSLRKHNLQIHWGQAAKQKTGSVSHNKNAPKNALKTRLNCQQSADSDIYAKGLLSIIDCKMPY